MNPFSLGLPNGSPRSVIRWVVRLILGLCFVSLGLNKAWHPADFLKAIHQYGWLEGSVSLTWITAWLPWFEVFCGLLLLVRIWARGSALVVFGMLLVFSAMILHRALRIQETSGIAFSQIRFDCGCGTGEVLVWRKLLENAVLAVLAATVFLRRF